MFAFEVSRSELGGSKEAIQSEMDIILLAVRVHVRENGRTQIKSIVVVANEAK